VVSGEDQCRPFLDYRSLELEEGEGVEPRPEGRPGFRDRLRTTAHHLPV